ncbi:hypothetical protein C7M84_021025 [Penaeus vannamei]|uniref:Uncharacterized protein n=1 Tax=Penaeus vannamei TaxID=6689 RepID=A0A3R7NL76_PENVA|nr:hypothetical protein C7M84_021025 [Penaeus vannamei]
MAICMYPNDPCRSGGVDMHLEASYTPKYSERSGFGAMDTCVQLTITCSFFRRCHFRLSFFSAPASQQLRGRLSGTLHPFAGFASRVISPSCFCPRPPRALYPCVLLFHRNSGEERCILEDARRDPLSNSMVPIFAMGALTSHFASCRMSLSQPSSSPAALSRPSPFQRGILVESAQAPEDGVSGTLRPFPSSHVTVQLFFFFWPGAGFIPRSARLPPYSGESLSPRGRFQGPYVHLAFFPCHFALLIFPGAPPALSLLPPFPRVFLVRSLSLEESQGRVTCHFLLPRVHFPFFFSRPRLSLAVLRLPTSIARCHFGFFLFSPPALSPSFSVFRSRILVRRPQPEERIQGPLRSISFFRLCDFAHFFFFSGAPPGFNPSSLFHA